MTTIIKAGTKQIDLEDTLKNAVPLKKLNAKKFSGIIKIEANPLDIQKKLRNEWG